MLPLYPIYGFAGETTTTLNTLLKEFYSPTAIVSQVNVDTWLLDKMDKAKKFNNVGTGL